MGGSHSVWVCVPQGGGLLSWWFVFFWGVILLAGPVVEAFNLLICIGWCMGPEVQVSVGVCWLLVHRLTVLYSLTIRVKRGLVICLYMQRGQGHHSISRRMAWERKTPFLEYSNRASMRTNPMLPFLVLKDWMICSYICCFYIMYQERLMNVQ